jgi:hypothetical protein
MCIVRIRTAICIAIARTLRDTATKRMMNMLRCHGMSATRERFLAKKLNSTSFTQKKYRKRSGRTFSAESPGTRYCPSVKKIDMATGPFLQIVKAGQRHYFPKQNGGDFAPLSRHVLSAFGKARKCAYPFFRRAAIGYTEFDLETTFQRCDQSGSSFTRSRRISKAFCMAADSRFLE